MQTKSRNNFKKEEQQTLLEEKRAAELQEKRNKEELNKINEYEIFKEIYEEGANDEITEEEFNEITIKKPDKSRLPTFVLSVALLKDIADFGFMGYIILPIFSVIVFFWLLSKSTWIRKRLIRKYILRAVVALIIALIPFVDYLPESAIFVYLVYRSEFGLFKKVVDALEKFEKAVDALEKFEKEFA